MKLDNMNMEQIKYVSIDRFSWDQAQRNKANLTKEILITPVRIQPDFKARCSSCSFYEVLIENHDPRTRNLPRCLLYSSSNNKCVEFSTSMMNVTVSI